MIQIGKHFISIQPRPYRNIESAGRLRFVDEFENYALELRIIEICVGL